MKAQASHEKKTTIKLEADSSGIPGVANLIFAIGLLFIPTFVGACTSANFSTYMPSFLQPPQTTCPELTTKRKPTKGQARMTCRIDHPEQLYQCSVKIPTTTYKPVTTFENRHKEFSFERYICGPNASDSDHTHWECAAKGDIPANALVPTRHKRFNQR